MSKITPVKFTICTHLVLPFFAQTIAMFTYILVHTRTTDEHHIIEKQSAISLYNCRKIYIIPSCCFSAASLHFLDKVHSV
jgi:hypothetical protein